MLQSLLPYLGTPRFHILALILASAAAFQSLIALWAATSPRHWFWRALAVWCAVAALVPIRAYEPALVFALSSPLTVLVIRASGWLDRRWRRKKSTAENQPTRPIVQFGLADILLLMLLIGMSLAALLYVFRVMPARPMPAIGWLDITLPAAAIVAINAVCHWIIRGPYRLGALAALIAAIPFSAWLLFSHVPWLENIDFLGIGHYVLFTNRESYVTELMTQSLLLAEFAALLLAASACYLYRPSQFAGTKFGHSCRLGFATVACCAFGLLYVQMLWLTPFPPSLPGDTTTYVRLLQIADFVNHGGPSSMKSELHAEVQTLVANDLALPFDLSSEPVLQMVERTSLDHIQAFRALSRSLEAESKAAAARGDFNSAAECAQANVRLGIMFDRNARLLDALIGWAIMGHGIEVLIGNRTNFDANTRQSIITNLRHLEAIHEPIDTIIWRDVAYSQRAYGWQARLQHIVQWLVSGPPPTWETNQSSRDAFNFWIAVSRLLQTDFAIRSFQTETGTLPESLKSLVPRHLPSLPLDPFSDRPFLYRPLDKDFELYSLGKNRTDDHGRFTNRMTYHQTDGFDLDLDTLTRP